MGWGFCGAFLGLFEVLGLVHFGFFNFCKFQTTLKCHEGVKNVHERHGEEKNYVPESRSNKINSQKF